MKMHKSNLTKWRTAPSVYDFKADSSSMLQDNIYLLSFGVEKNVPVQRHEAVD